MNRNIFTSLVFLLFAQTAGAQALLVYANKEFTNPEQQQVFALWKQYVNQTDQQDTLWTFYDRQHYPGTDLMKDAMGLSGGLYKFSLTYNVLSIEPIGENYKIRTALFWDEPDSFLIKKPHLFSIINVIAVKEKNGYKLSNFINEATANWYRQQVGKIIYHYPASHPFDRFKAGKANALTDSLEKWFGFSADTINYYIPENCTDGYKIAGFEFTESEDKELNLCGYYDQRNNVIYANTVMGEYYEHELIHQINKRFPKANTFLLTGLSAYINDAGSRGKSIRFHLQRYQAYLKDHPTDFNKLGEIKDMDGITSTNYIFGAMICNALMRKGGISLLKEALNLDMKKDSQIIDYLKKTFSTNDLNTFFNTEFKIYLNQKEVLLKT